MPKPYPVEFRDDVVAVARKGEAPRSSVRWPRPVPALRSGRGGVQGEPADVLQVVK